jgi:MFS family permease
MQTMAQQVLVYRLTQSASALGIVNFMAAIPIVPLALWGGSLSDRVSKRKVIVITQALMLVQAVILTVLTWTGEVEIWHIYLMSFFLGALKAVDTPARQSFVIEMVEGKEDLANAIGLNSAIHNGARTLGPALAGVVVATMGEAVAFLINSVSFVAVLVSLLMMKGLPEKTVEIKEKPKMISHLAEGLRFIKGQRTILVLISLLAVSSFLSKPYRTLLPVFADNMLKESAQPLIDVLCKQESAIFDCKVPEALPLGLLFAALGLGAMVGAVVVASLPSGARLGRMLTLGNLSFPLFLLIFVNLKVLPLSLAVIFLVGMSNVLQNSMINTSIQIMAPDHLRGRVMSLYSLISQGMSRVGGLQAGFTADFIGAPLSVGIGAFFSLLYGLFVSIRFKEIRKTVLWVEVQNERGLAKLR